MDQHAADSPYPALKLFLHLDGQSMSFRQLLEGQEHVGLTDLGRVTAVQVQNLRRGYLSHDLLQAIQLALNARSRQSAGPPLLQDDQLVEAAIPVLDQLEPDPIETVKSGDVVRVDGKAGTLEIVKRK